MTRFRRFNDGVVPLIFASKGPSFYFSRTSFKTIRLTAGLYKLASLSLEHVLMLSSISGALAATEIQIHGKRQKRTASVTVDLTGAKLWPALDKLSHELLPRMIDFKTPKFHRPSLANNYMLRVRQKFTPLLDFETLVDQAMFESHKGVYLPLTAHFGFLSSDPYINEQYLRVFRLPFNFYVKRQVPAFDDPINL
jgi:hypothetical protein